MVGIAANPVTNGVYAADVDHNVVFGVTDP